MDPKIAFLILGGVILIVASSGGTAKAAAKPPMPPMPPKPPMMPPMPPGGTPGGGAGAPGFPSAPPGFPIPNLPTSLPEIPTKFPPAPGMGAGPQVTTLDVGTASGFPSDPTTQWVYVVRPNESPAYISRRVTGSDLRYTEMFAANPARPTRTYPEAPNGFRQNFSRFNAGDLINLPKSWNLYIDSNGIVPAPGFPVQ